MEGEAVTVHDFLRRVCAGYVCLLFLFPVVVLAFVSLATPTMMGGLVLPALLSVLAGNFAYYVMPRCEFVYRKAMVCPACKQNVLGAISKSQFRAFQFFKPLVPTHCRSCAADLRLLAYCPARFWIPRPMDDV